MEAESSRSEQVIKAYKRHKLSVSALHHIRRMLRGFEQERAADRRLALIGVVVILAMLALAAWFFLGGDRMVIS